MPTKKPAAKEIANKSSEAEVIIAAGCISTP